MQRVPRKQMGAFCRHAAKSQSSIAEVSSETEPSDRHDGVADLSGASAGYERETRDDL